MSGIRRWFLCWLAILSISIFQIVADVPGGEGVPKLVRGNERLGRLLLREIHRNNPERNVAVSPVSLTIILAAIQNSSWDSQLGKEIGDVFGWEQHPGLGVPAKMLLAAFDKPTLSRSQPAKMPVKITPSKGLPASQEG